MNKKECSAKESAPYSLGKLAETAGVTKLIPREEILAALDQHRRHDWIHHVEICPIANEMIPAKDCHLFSEFESKDGICFWIITEADRSMTTVLLPSEY